MHEYNPYLDQISHRAEELIDQLAQWVHINSQTYNREGLKRMVSLLEASFAPLGGHMESREVGTVKVLGVRGRERDRPLGWAMRVRKRPDAPLRVLLCGHMDTVLNPAKRPKRKERSEGRLWGTGAADAKGGLAVMLAALNCMENSPYAKRLGWEVLIVPDEEIGSPMSKPLLVDAAKNCQIGLVFEPALPDGALVGERPGSGNFVVIVHGRAAHAGREPEAGRNAIDALADLIVSLRSLKTEGAEIRLNVGQIEGGGPVNVVPDFALCRFNLRVRTLAAMKAAEETIARLTAQAEKIEGISVEVKGGFGRPPKTLDPETLYLLKHLMVVGRDLDLSLRFRSSGGVCDGNTLSWAGLPNVDSMGPVGDGIHTTQEFVIETSIPERARLIALFLMKLANGEIRWPPTETDLTLK